jgi:hypothetical protein
LRPHRSRRLANEERYDDETPPSMVRASIDTRRRRRECLGDRAPPGATARRPRHIASSSNTTAASSTNTNRASQSWMAMLDAVTGQRSDVRLMLRPRARDVDRHALEVRQFARRHRVAHVPCDRHRPVHPHILIASEARGHSLLAVRRSAAVSRRLGGGRGRRRETFVPL